MFGYMKYILYPDEYKDRSARKNKSRKKITGYLETAGFTEADYEEQMELAGVEVALPLSFTIALEYRLADDGIEVSVPASMIEENGGGSLYRIRLLGSKMGVQMRKHSVSCWEKMKKSG